jgi:hypothetical protein
MVPAAVTFSNFAATRAGCCVTPTTDAEGSVIGTPAETPTKGRTLLADRIVNQYADDVEWSV